MARSSIFVSISALSLFAASGCGVPSAPQTLPPADAVVVTRQPFSVATHSFEPTAPPPEMPPLADSEQAECASDFISNASVSGRSVKTDSTHATLTVTRVQMTLQLRINIWVPQGVSQRVMDHEEGHRQISEHFYENADQVSRQVAASYIGKELSLSGPDLGAEINKALQQLSAQVTDDYSRKVSPELAQQRFDDLTDHARNDLAAADAVAQALKGSS